MIIASVFTISIKLDLFSSAILIPTYAINGVETQFGDFRVRLHSKRVCLHKSLNLTPILNSSYEDLSAVTSRWAVICTVLGFL